MAAIQATFTGPRYYDELLAPATFGPFADDLAARWPRRLPGAVLEVACGTGALTRPLRARLDPAVHLVATDLSAAMLEYARSRSAQEPGITWQEADAQRLPFPGGSFAGVACGFGFMFAPDRPAALKEAHRVLAPGGLLLFNVWDRIEANPHALVYAEVVEAMFPDDAQMRFRVPYEMHDEALLRDWLAQAGFGDVHVETVRLPIRGVDPVALATGQIRGTPRSALIAQRGVAVEDVIAAVASALERQGGRPYAGHAQALVVRAAR